MSLGTELRVHYMQQPKGSILMVGSMLLLCLTTCSMSQPSTLSSAHALGWEGNHYLWASGYVENVETTVTVRYDTRNGDAMWFDFGFDLFLSARDATIWVLNRYSVNQYRNGDWQRSDRDGGLPAGPFWSMLEASDGSIWVGGSGLSRYDPDSGNWDVMVPSLPDVCIASDCAEIEAGAVYALVQDKKEAIWAGTTQGVIRLSNGSWRSWTTGDGLTHNSIRVLVQGEDGVIWAGTGDGVNWWDGNQWHAWPDPGKPDPFPGFRVNITQIVAARDGRIWATSPYSLMMWNGEIWDYVDFPCYGDHKISTLMEASDGNIWVGTNGGGVCRWNGQHWQAYLTSQELSSNRVLALLESPDGLIWAGSLSGIDCYKPTRDQWYPFMACRDP